MMNKNTTKQYINIIEHYKNTTKCSRVEALSENLVTLYKFVPS